MRGGARARCHRNVCADGASQNESRGRVTRHGARRLSRSPGPQRLPAARASARRPLDRVHRPSRRALAQSSERRGGAQRHLDPRCDRSQEPALSRPRSRRSGEGRGGRRADGAGVRRLRAAQGRQEQGLPAAQLRRHGARDLGRGRPGQARSPHHRRRQARGHAQELVGVRHGHRGSRLGRRRLARPAPSAGLRPERSGEARVGAQLRVARARARRERSGAEHATRARFDRRETQSRLFRLWCKQPRRPEDRRPKKALDRPKRAHARKLRLSAGPAARFPAAIRRAHDVSRSGHGDRGIRQGQGRAQAGFRRRDRRNLPQRVPGGAPDGHLRRRHRRDSAGRRVELGRAREKRRLLQPRRALRHALLERELRSRLLQAHHVLCALQRRSARTRHPRSFPSEGDRLLCSRRHGKDREALRRQGGGRALQDRNPDQQRRGRRARLHLRGRPRQHRNAHSAAHRRRTGGNEMKSYWIRPESGKTTLELRDAPVPEPGPGQLLVRMRAAGLNRGELIVGHSVKAGGPAKAGRAAGSGDDAKVGAGVTGLSTSQRVMGRCAGSFAEYSLMDAREAIVVPKNLSWEEAGSIPLAFMVVHDMLIAQGKLKAGEWLLVTGISAGVGVAALQTGKALGAKVIGTSGSAEKLERLKAMGLDAGVRTRAGDFADAVMKATGGKGANLVVNNVGGSMFAETLRALAYEGRHATVGYVDGVLKSEIDIEALHTKRLTLFGVSNRLRNAEQRAVTLRGFAADILPYLADGPIKPPIDRRYSFAELPRPRTTWNRMPTWARSRCASTENRRQTTAFHLCRADTVW